MSQQSRSRQTATWKEDNSRCEECGKTGLATKLSLGERSQGMYSYGLPQVAVRRGRGCRLLLAKACDRHTTHMIKFAYDKL